MAAAKQSLIREKDLSSLKCMNKRPIPFHVQCLKCDFTAIDKVALKKHTEETHHNMKKETRTENKKVQCLECKKEFIYKSSLKDHIKMVHDRFYDQFCSMCDKSFTRKSDLNRHIRDVHEKTKYKRTGSQCLECKKELCNKKSLKQHMKFVHDRLYDQFCNICDKSFTRKCELSRHIREVHEKLRYIRILKTEVGSQCLECKMELCSTDGLIEHMKIVHDKLYAQFCSICDKSFIRKSALIRHIKEVHEKNRVSKDRVKKVFCHLCKAGFFRNSEMNAHVKQVHFKVFRNSCEKCTFTTGQKRELKRHIAETHNGLLMCLYCDFAVKDLVKLKAHAMSEHNIKSPNIKANLCAICGFTTSHRASLRTHMKREHAEDNDVQIEYDNNLLQVTSNPLLMNPKNENVQSKTADKNAVIMLFCPIMTCKFISESMQELNCHLESVHPLK